MSRSDDGVKLNFQSINPEASEELKSFIKLENASVYLPKFSTNIKQEPLEGHQDSDFTPYGRKLMEENNNFETRIKTERYETSEETDDFFEEFRNNYPKENKSLGIDVHGEEIIKNQINQLTSPASIAKYSCEQCSYSSPIKKSFKRHLQVHRDPEKWFYCGKCNYKTRQNGHLTRHQLTHKAISECNEIFICGICQYKFKQKCTLKRHILDTHGTHKKNYASQNDLPVFKCDSCPYSSIRRGLYLAHLDKHKDPKDVGNLYICDVCKFSTKYRRNLRVHLETHRDDVTKTIYECKICNFRSRLHYCLKRHLLSKKHLTVVGKSSEYCPREIRMKQEERDSDCEVKEFVETHEVKVEVYDEFEEVCKGVKVEPKEEEGFGVKVEC